MRNISTKLTVLALSALFSVMQASAQMESEFIEEQLNLNAYSTEEEYLLYSDDANYLSFDAYLEYPAELMEELAYEDSDEMHEDYVAEEEMLTKYMEGSGENLVATVAEDIEEELTPEEIIISFLEDVNGYPTEAYTTEADEAVISFLKRAHEPETYTTEADEAVISFLERAHEPEAYTTEADEAIISFLERAHEPEAYTTEANEAVISFLERAHECNIEEFAWEDDQTILSELDPDIDFNQENDLEMSDWLSYLL